MGRHIVIHKKLVTNPKKSVPVNLQRKTRLELLGVSIRFEFRNMPIAISELYGGPPESVAGWLGLGASPPDPTQPGGGCRESCASDTAKSPA